MTIWDAAAHPRTASGPGGGEFTAKSGSSKQAAPAKTTKAPKRAGAAPHGSMSFNGHTGTGYGSKRGDARVRHLQQALNRLHMTDAHGKPLKVDGKLGPKTTAAIKKWQKAHGMKANGVVTPAMLKAATARTHKKAALGKKTAIAKKKAPAPRRPPAQVSRKDLLP